MGLLHKHYLHAPGPHNRIYVCRDCHTHLSTATDIVSKQFQGQTGRAFLFQKVVNVTLGEREDRQMTTGLHTVRDVLCIGCGLIVGWTYIYAFEESQRYKEGKTILEKALVDDLPDPDVPAPLNGAGIVHLPPPTLRSLLGTSSSVDMNGSSRAAAARGGNGSSGSGSGGLVRAAP
ncbi:yippee zinc-binding/DNA-binding /Mis18, centromere assembly-domain-containing protein [Blastocladiella britannica]|nr:yippee zinc-binding/DNA-binding /Mis18, centromere assembly-domain-containing protein [Blastocladiella britannica]